MNDCAAAVSNDTPVASAALHVASSSATQPDDERLLGGRYRALTLGVVTLVALVALEALAIGTVMPVAAAALEGVSWYGLAFGAPLATSVLGMVAAGLWSDARGPARPLWAGIALFGAGLLAAALAPSIGWLVAGRAASGLGAGLISVALYALVGRAYPPALHGRVFAAFSTAWILPSLLGPALTGLVAERFGWRWVLVGLLIVAGVATAMLRRPLRAVAAPRGPAQPMLARTTWAAGAALGALLLHVAGQRSSDAEGFATFAVALVLLCVCGRKLLPRGTLHAARGLPAALALHGLSQAAFFTAEAFLPLLLVRERGLSVAGAGLLLSAGALTWSAGAACRARALRVLGTGRLLQLAAGFVAAGVATTALVVAPAVPVASAVASWAIAGFGMGLISPTISVLTLALAEPGQQGATGAALRLIAALATAVALALGGSAFAALVDRAPTSAYLCCLGGAAVIAAVGSAIATRVERR